MMNEWHLHKKFNNGEIWKIRSNSKSKWNMTNICCKNKQKLKKKLPRKLKPKKWTIKTGKEIFNKLKYNLQSSKRSRI